MDEPRLTRTVPAAAELPEPKAPKGGVRAAEAVAAQRQLTDRDHTLLQLLAEHYVLTTDQIARMLFASDNVARKRLVLLTRRGVLARFRACQRPGSQSWRYVLGPLGAMIHAAATDTRALPTPAKTHERALKLARSPRLAHLLGVNDVFTHLAAHARTTDDSRALVEWLSERHATDACASIARPDAYGHWQENGRDIEFFLEYDTGTEKLATVVKKITEYRELADAGITLPVLFVFPGPHRERHFHHALAQHAPNELRHVPIATTTTHYAHTTPATQAWRPVGSQARRDLIDLPATPTT